VSSQKVEIGDRIATTIAFAPRKIVQVKESKGGQKIKDIA